MDCNKSALAGVSIQHMGYYLAVLFPVLAWLSQILLFFLSFGLISWNLFLFYVIVGHSSCIYKYILLQYKKAISVGKFFKKPLSPPSKLRKMLSLHIILGKFASGLGWAEAAAQWNSERLCHSF